MSRVHYNDEMRLQTVKLVLKGEKSATKIAKDIGVNPNIVDMTSLLANGHDRGVGISGNPCTSLCDHETEM